MSLLAVVAIRDASANASTELEEYGNVVSIALDLERDWILALSSYTGPHRAITS
jgi:hypothetical protein